MSGPSSARAFCYRCHKAQSLCVCGYVERVANRTEIYLVQHPRERFHPLGTARFVALGLERATIVRSDTHAAEPPAAIARGAALLYPEPGGALLGSLAPAERPATLVVIDGTWAQARTIYRDCQWLHALPRFRLAPSTPSRYRLRREPRAECLSTIEAIVDALGALEPETAGLDGLLGAFERMIDDQLGMIARHRSGSRQRALLRTVAGIPDLLAREPERVVVASGEAAPRPPDADARDPNAARARIPAHWAGVRIAGGAVFERFVRPPEGRFPRPRHLEHMGLRAEELEGGLDLDALRGEWARFVGPDDVLVCWSSGVLSLLRHALGSTQPSLHLKSAFRSSAKHTRGSLDDVVAALDLRPEPCGVKGRAGRTIAATLALLGHLRARFDHVAERRREELARGR
ncbi:MAG: DTW domain-containing protein [Myxococcales bacterium]|nr:DTW domain-containing protein [Myxococcales bacterium]